MRTMNIWAIAIKRLLISYHADTNSSLQVQIGQWELCCFLLKPSPQGWEMENSDDYMEMMNIKEQV